MMRILMAGTGSGGGKNFEQTVRNPVNLEQYADNLTVSERQRLKAKHGRSARVWGFEAKSGASVIAAAELKPGDQAWFHHDNYVHTVAEVVIVFRNLKFAQALWADSDYPASAFVFTMAEPQNAQISKAAVNKLLGYRLGNTWQQNRLLDKEASKLLISRVCLAICTSMR